MPCTAHHCLAFFHKVSAFIVLAMTASCDSRLYDSSDGVEKHRKR
jgi:hypothetical protein